jgi:hypothetical protein
MTFDPLARSMREGDVRGFHYRDTLCFFREADGSVRIEKTGIALARIDPYSWASVVASMSLGGEDAASYATARDFHGCPSFAPQGAAGNRGDE